MQLGWSASLGGSPSLVNMELLRLGLVRLGYETGNTSFAFRLLDEARMDTPHHWLERAETCFSAGRTAEAIALTVKTLTTDVAVRRKKYGDMCARVCICWNPSCSANTLIIDLLTQGLESQRAPKI